jgi:hypothetical protein
MKFIKIVCRIALSVIIFSVILGIIFSCITSKNNGNETLAQMELNLLMFKIENKIINLNTSDDQEYIKIAHNFTELINIIGKIKSQKEHYFRVYFSRAPETLDKMVEIIMDKDNNIFEWGLLPWQNMAFHMYGKDGEYNLKFISADGHFEAVYNKDGILLTQDNDPLNMGTFNYAHQLADQMTHYNLDVWPYFMWNNTPEAMEASKEVKDAQPIDKNEEAMKRYKEYEKKLNEN